jgi:hypothetical protein
LTSQLDPIPSVVRRLRRAKFQPHHGRHPAYLIHLVKDKDQKLLPRRKLSDYLTKIARLGGYLARANDPPPGNTVMWRGLSRLTDIELGAIIGARIVGN